MIKRLLTLGLTLTALTGSVLAGNYDIYGSLRVFEQQNADIQEQIEQERYEYQQEQLLDELNQRLQYLQDSIQVLSK